ncbi:MAG: sulfotransferase [Calothrix sp. MO_192.B10]|nr:sulfotransferase [Calothrix sp. MO_192.B10]
MTPNYILIVGQGRSGTNWLLDILDASTTTHCRNEPNELETSLLAQLPAPTVKRSLDNNFGKQWDRSMSSAALKMSGRDRIDNTNKFYLYQGIFQWVGISLFSKKWLRLLASSVMPQLNQPDWLIPWWFANSQALKEASTVLKLNQAPAWADWVLNNRPNTIVIHIVRHPGGFLNSWQKRYLKVNDTDEVKKANAKRLKQIADIDPYWAKLFGDIEAMEVDESELWYWRYASETIHAAGNHKPNYIRIIYEDLVSDTLKISKQIYQKCNLPWTKEIETSIFNSTSNSNVIASAWRKHLNTQQIALVERVVSDSPMSQWWQDISPQTAGVVSYNHEF